MGANQSQRQLEEPENIAEFRQLPDIDDHFIIPELPEKRKLTDAKFIIIFAGCIFFLVPFLIYTLVNSDLDRLVHGYDKCGNICGKRNYQIDGISCTGQDRTREPFLMYRRDSSNRYLSYYDSTSVESNNELVPEKCVEKCGSNYIEILNRCFPTGNSNEANADVASLDQFLADIANDINRSSGYIFALCFIGLGFSIGMLVLFRYFVAVVVWVILIGSLLGFFVLTGFFWYLSGQVEDRNNNGTQIIAIVFTICSVILTAILICMLKRIQMIIRLFKEAIKVIFGIPLILFEPFLTFIASSILFVIFVYFLVLMETSGFLQQVSSYLYAYTPSGAMLFTLWYHVIICVWMEQFIIGCQHMVIAGSVSAYFFTRNKTLLGNPIYNSFYNLIRYHLGTVAFGSFIITVVAVIKELVRGLVNSRQAKALVDCSLGAVEDFLKYLSKNAYIQTAMHGQPFYKSGKRAVRLLAANALSAIAINSVGDFVLFMSKLLIMICTILVGVLMRDPTITHFWAAIVISAIVTAIIANCFFAVFETAIDTIFICFCEDKCMNDGETRPYYMSTEFMQYIEEAKKKNGNCAL